MSRRDLELTIDFPIGIEAKSPKGPSQLLRAGEVVAVNGDGIGLDDVQELRAKLVRRDGGVWSPQSLMLRRMDCRIASEAMTRQKFDDSAAAVWRLLQVLPGVMPLLAMWKWNGRAFRRAENGHGFCARHVTGAVAFSTPSDPALFAGNAGG